MNTKSRNSLLSAQILDLLMSEDLPHPICRVITERLGMERARINSVRKALQRLVDANLVEREASRLESGISVYYYYYYTGPERARRAARASA